MKDLRNHNILVVGSSNTDMVIKTNHLPRPGETVLGGTFFYEPGWERSESSGCSCAVRGDKSRLFVKQAVIYSDINPSSYLRKRGLILPIFSQIRRIHLA